MPISPKYRSGSWGLDYRSQAGEMENHLQRQEVQQALTEGTGRSTRYSGTLMERSLYVAQLLSDGTVLRLSVTQYSVLRLMLQMSESLILIVAGVLALGDAWCGDFYGLDGAYDPERTAAFLTFLRELDFQTALFGHDEPMTKAAVLEILETELENLKPNH